MTAITEANSQHQVTLPHSKLEDTTTGTKFQQTVEVENQDPQLHQVPNKQKETSQDDDQDHKDKVKDFVLNKIPIIGYAIATAGHFFSALAHVNSSSSEKVKDFCDKASLLTSKAANIFTYLITTYRAFENKLGLDALSRFLYVVFVPFADQEDFYLYSGFSSGLTNIEQPQKRLVQGKYHSNRSNLQAHLKAFPQMWKETCTGLFGPQSKIFCSRSKDQGHMMHLFSHGNFIGALLSVIAGRGSSPLKKLASIVRNVGSVGVDISMLNCSDASKKSGIAYIATAILDVVQAFSDNPVMKKVTSHISICMNNLANYFYTLGTKEAVEGDFSFGASKQENKKAKPVLEFVPPLTSPMTMAQAA